MFPSPQVQKAFTLIELLVIIAIIAVLAVVVILTLNPNGLLQEARDSNRVSDLANLKNALSLYATDIPSPSMGTAGTCYVSISTSSFTIPGPATSTATTTVNCSGWFSSTPTTVNTSTPNRSVTSTVGWIPINLTQINGGSPLAQWPIDPLNRGTNFYSYAASSTNGFFKIASFMESRKYAASGTADVVSTDGGNDNFVLEEGSSMNL